MEGVMSKDFKQIAGDVMTGVGLLQRGSPDTMKAFAALSAAATASNALDTKTKELMALAVGIAVHCDGCVAFHTKMAHQHGATRQEVAETVSLAVYMGGGPAAVYGGMRCAHTISLSAQTRNVRAAHHQEENRAIG
jgi:AhpD family alkylhydroperoxidase